MALKKIDLAAMHGKISRAEMKTIKAGSGEICYSGPNANCVPGLGCINAEGKPKLCSIQGGFFCCM